MIIEINGKEYDLKTNMGAIKRIEAKTGRPLGNVLANLSVATVDELIRILTLAENEKSSNLADEIIDRWDYFDLQMTVQAAVLRMLFSGTPEQQEAKVDGYPVGEPEKNEMRRVLGLPLKALPSTSDGGKTSSEPPLE